MDGRNVQARPDRQDPRTADRGGLSLRRRRLPPERMYPAGEPGVRVTRVTVEGVGVRVVLAGPDSGTAVVLVHGWGACVYSFAEMIPALAGAGHRVIAVDLPGFGLSDKPT